MSNTFEQYPLFYGDYMSSCDILVFIYFTIFVTHFIIVIDTTSGSAKLVICVKHNNRQEI